MLYEHYLDLLDDVEKLMTELRRYRDDDVRESVTALLQRLDLVHREGLVRFVEALRAQDAGPVIDRVIDDDPIVRIVLGLYGLADLGLPPDDDGRAQEQVGFFPVERLTVHRAGSARPAGRSAESTG